MLLKVVTPDRMITKPAIDNIQPRLRQKDGF
jgi:hypothetical protein